MTITLFDASQFPAVPSYPSLLPYNHGHLAVGQGHRVYFEEVGNPQGQAVLFLHGGPGTGCNERHRQLFNPDRVRLILHDQRGSGRSTPFACVEHNTTWDLVRDIEQLREHLGLERWLVVGGSWGSTLALAYAQRHPERVTGLVLRGVFLATDEEIRYFYQEGAHVLSPHYWEPYVNHIPLEERHDLLTAYHKRLMSDDADVRLAACKQWAMWELNNLTLAPLPNMEQWFNVDTVSISLARIENHYFMNHSFFNEDTRLLNPERLARIQHIPTTLIHGRYDMVCPLATAWTLHQALPQSHLIICPTAGHASDELGIKEAQHWAVEQAMA